MVIRRRRRRAAPAPAGTPSSANARHRFANCSPSPPAREEGIFGGFSGGACLVAAEQLLRDRHAGQTVVIVIADSGMKYVSMDLWKAD
jgi:hypothetical protein